MNSLKKLYVHLFGQRDKQEIAEAVRNQPPQHLTRFIYQSGHFSPANRKVKPNAFLPEPSQLKISSAYTDSLDEPGIWTVGDVLGKLRRVPMVPIARADFPSVILGGLRLEIERDPIPHPRHLNICSWPSSKDAQKAIALDLCRMSTLNVR